jgi:hypothetical protein
MILVNSIHVTRRGHMVKSRSSRCGGVAISTPISLGLSRLCLAVGIGYALAPSRLEHEEGAERSGPTAKLCFA